MRRQGFLPGFPKVSRTHGQQLGLTVGWILVFLLGLPCLSAGSPVKAEVDRRELSLGQSLRLTVTIEGTDGQVDLSGLTDFKVIQQGQSQQIQMGSSGVHQELVYTYTLIPKQKGALRIPPLPVSVNGKPHRTRAIDIQVLARGTSRVRPKGKDGKTVFVRARVSNASPYVGEQLVYTFQLFYRQPLDDIRFGQPDFSGFTAEQIGKDRGFQTRIAGKRYQGIERRYLLMPVAPGPREIAPATLRCNLVQSRQRGGRGFFDDFFPDPFSRNTRPVSLSTRAISLNVQSLPAYTGDTPFSGLVGRFELSARIDKQQLKVGESATLSLILKGRGNLQDLEPLQPAIPAHFKSYADTTEEQIELDPQGYHGQRIFRYALVPTRPGEFTLPGVTLAYFDPESKTYARQQTRAISLQVQPSSKEEPPVQVTSPGERGKPEKQAVEFTGRDILPIKERLDLLEDQKPLSLGWFVLFLLLPGLLFGGVKLGLDLARPATDPASQMDRRAGKALKRASRAADPQTRLTALYQAVVSAILARAKLRGESLTYAEARRILEETGYGAEQAEQGAELLAAIESAKFSGEERQADPDALWQRTRRFIQMLSAKE